MEPADIDWKRVESRYVRDEALENINAPRWVDLSNPDESFSVDDESWFCRPECRHPKTFEDFKRLESPSPKGKLITSSSEVLPLGERNGVLREANNNLKRRGGIGAFLSSSSPFRDQSKSKPYSKKPHTDLENQNPNIPNNSIGISKAGKSAKSLIKSSAEKKRPDEEREELLLQEKQRDEERNQSPSKLKSTLSARNLFTGRDLLSQISELCNEIKRLAVGTGQVSSPVGEESDSPMNSGKQSSKTVKLRDELERENFGERATVLREVRENPPTPQRFPSPSSHRFKQQQTKVGGIATCSPLKKPPKSTPERRILKEKEQVQPLVSKDEKCNNNSSVASDSGVHNTVGMFWFFKPCTYLVE